MVAVGVVPGLALAGCQSGTTHGSSPGGVTPSATTSSPASHVLPPSIAPGDAPPVFATAAATGPPCAVSQLKLTASPRPPGDTQDLGVVLVWQNTGSTACTLSGMPRMVAHGAGVPDVTAYPDPIAVGGPSGRVGVLPGGYAFVRLRVPSGCATIPPSSYDSVTVTVSGLGSFTLATHSFPIGCGAFVSPFYL